MISMVMAMGSVASVWGGIIANDDVSPTITTWVSSTYGYVGKTGDGSLTVDGDSDLESRNCYISHAPGLTGAVTVDGAGSTWANTYNLYVGQYGVGALNINDGGEVSNKWCFVGYSSGSTGEVTVDGAGSTFTNSGYIRVGDEGGGVLNIRNSGAVISAGDTSVAYDPGSSGTINFSNGTLTTGGLLYDSDDLTGAGTINSGGLVGDIDLVFDSTHGLSQALTINGNAGQNIALNLTVNGFGSMGAGYNGSGTTSISDGLVIESTYGYIGYKSGSVGEVTVDGANSKWTNSENLHVGYYGSGTLDIAGGGVVSGDDGMIGLQSGSAGKVTVDGTDSRWSVSGPLTVGYFGNGELNITSGGSVNNANSGGVIGNSSGSTGEVTVHGTDSTWTSYSLDVGASGSGVLDITGGGSVSNGTGKIGRSSGSEGEVTVSGANSTWTNTSMLTVGRYGGAAMNVVNAGSVSNSLGYIGEKSGSTGAVTVDGVNSTWTNSSFVIVGYYGNGTLNITGGGEVSNTTGLVGEKSGSIGEVTVDGSGSTWTNSSNLTVGSAGSGTVIISDKGLVTVGGNASFGSSSLMAVEVSNNDMITVAGDLTNNGLVRLAAQADLPVGVYTPISVTGSWLGTGGYEAFGGLWKTSNHTFTVAEAAEATAGVQTTIDLYTGQRINVGNSLNVNFMPTGGANELTFTATNTSAEVRSNLSTVLGEGEFIQGSWDFDITGLPGGDDVMLSFASSGELGSDDVTIWHYDDTNGWTEYDATDLIVAGGWVSFSVDSFSSYAITGTPEPATMTLLALGGLAVLRRRRRK